MPLKMDIIQHLDEASPESLATGACNTIVRVKRNGSIKLAGTNTDFVGVRNALLASLGTQHPSVTISTTATYATGQASGMVIGGGATTRSAVHALYTLGMNPIFIVGRDVKEVRATIEHFHSTSMVDAPGHPKLIHLDSVDQAEGLLGPAAENRLPGVAMIVGAIPAILPLTVEERTVYTIVAHILSLPFSPLVEESPTSLPVPSPRIFLDMAYKPRMTPLLKIASAFGWEIVGGIQAMIEQGLAQQRMWLSGTTSLSVASDESLLPAEVVRRARELVENLKDIVPDGPELDKSQC